MRQLFVLAVVGVATALSAASAVAAPSLSGGSVSPGTWSSAPTMAVQWTQSGMEGDGPTLVQVQMNTSDDGTATGTWQGVWGEAGTTSGPRLATISTDMWDGKRAMRVVVIAGSQVVAALALNPALIDRTPPVLSRPGALYSPTQNVFSWAEEDLHAGLDPAAGYTLEVNTSPNQTYDGAWVAMPFMPSGEGAQTATIPAPVISPGAHAVRVRVADKAGNEATQHLGIAYNDTTPPSVTSVRVADAPTAASQSVELTYLFSDGSGSGFEPAAPTALTTESGATVLWEGFHHMPGGDNRIRAHLPGPKTYRLVMRMTDRVGNVGVSAPITVVAPARGVAGPNTPLSAGPDGAGSPALLDVPRPALRMNLSLVGARVRGGVAVARIVHGQSVTVRGTLTTASGRAERREEIEVRDPSGRMLGRATTDGSGRFRVTVAPHTGGDLRVGIPLGGGRLALPTSSATVRIVVRPKVTLSASTRDAVAGASPVVFTGRVSPGPGTLKGTPRKRVVLEWLDPLRREWRPVLNGYAGADGRYRFSWRFGVPGFSIPMRVSVPAELGWPFAPVVSRVVTVVVR
jgi:Bacterial Ig domain